MAAPHFDLLLYAVHLGFWASLGVGRLFNRRPASAAPVAAAAAPATAAGSRAVLAVHLAAFAVMYFGIAQAVIPGLVPERFPHQRLTGTLVIAAGAALAAWALAVFDSWRFRAQLEAGHRLCTSGPFRLVRNPIYVALNLLAIGSALWVPTRFLAVAVALMLLGSDLRARAEEKLLAGSFGPPYAEYAAKTKRFIPGLY